VPPRIKNSDEKAPEDPGLFLFQGRWFLMRDEHIFVVRRRLVMTLGVVFLALGVLPIPAALLSGSPYQPKLFWSSLILIVVAVFCIKSVRNVREIRIDAEGMWFLPVGAQLLFAEIEWMEVPSWMDRHDTPPRSLGVLRLKMKHDGGRLVPGAFWHWKGLGDVYLYGCDSDAILTLLKERIARH